MSAIIILKNIFLFPLGIIIIAGFMTLVQVAEPALLADKTLIDIAYFLWFFYMIFKTAFEIRHK